MSLHFEILGTWNLLWPCQSVPAMGLDCPALYERRMSDDWVGAISISACGLRRDEVIEGLQAACIEETLDHLKDIIPSEAGHRALWASSRRVRTNWERLVWSEYWRTCRRDHPQWFEAGACFDQRATFYEEMHLCDRPSHDPDAGPHVRLGLAEFARPDFGCALRGIYEQRNKVIVLVLPAGDSLSEAERRTLTVALEADEPPDRCLLIKDVLTPARFLITGMYDHGWNVAEFMIIGRAEALFRVAPRHIHILDDWRDEHRLDRSHR